MKQNPPSTPHTDQHFSNSVNSTAGPSPSAQHGLDRIQQSSRRGSERLTDDSHSDSDGEEFIDDDLLSKTIVFSTRQPYVMSSLDGLEKETVFPSDHEARQVPSAEKSRAAHRATIRPSSSSSSSHGEGGPTGPSLIDDLPIETLTRILALLDPAHLVKASLVCKRWYSIARDDATWRLAFCKAFGLGGGAGVMRRIDASSWKAEYRTRLDLMRRWRKSRSPAISSDMRVANIHSLAISSRHSFLLSASSMYGVASRSDPFRGKVARGFLDAAGLLNGGGIGNPNTEFSPDVSCLAISSSASKIVWGFKTGAIAITSLERQGSNPHGLVRNVKFSPRGNHLGEVNAIALDRSVRGQQKRTQLRQMALGGAAECFVTGGTDGTVRLWSPDRALPIWIGSIAIDPQDDTGAPDLGTPRLTTSPTSPSVTKLDFDADIGIIAAGTSSGHLHLWKHIDVNLLNSLSDGAWSDVEGNTEEITTAKQDAARKAFKEESAKVIKIIFYPAENELGRLHRNIEGRGQVDYICLAADRPSSIQAIVHRRAEASLECHMMRETSQGSSVVTKVLAMTGSSADHQLGGEGYITCVRAELGAVKADIGQTEEIRAATSPLRSAPVDTASTQHDKVTRPPTVEALVLGRSACNSRNLSAGPFAEKDFVCVGTSSGCLVGWVLPSFEEAGEDLEMESGSSIPQKMAKSVSSPSFVLDCHPAPLTSLDLAPHLFVVGTVDGQLKAFDSLTGESVRTWTDRTATKHLARQLLSPEEVRNGTLSTDERERFTVKQILVDEEWLVAAIGPWVLAWRPESGLSGHQKRHASRLTSPHLSGTPPSGSRRASGMAPLSKYARMKELKNELAESSLILERERESRQASYERLRFARGSDEVGGLSEDEALEYAIILSRQDAEEQAQHSGRGDQGQKDVPLSELARIRREDRELQDALEQIALAEDEESRATISSGGASPGSRLSRSPSDADGLYFEDEEEGHCDGGEVDYFLGARRHYLSPSPHASPNLLPSSPNRSSSTSRAWEILRSSRSASSSGAASPLPMPTSAQRSRWGEHTKVQTVRVSREHWSPRTQPTTANDRPMTSANGDTDDPRDNWPTLQSGSESSSQRSTSPLPQERFKLDDDDVVYDLPEVPSCKGKERANTIGGLPRSTSVPPSGKSEVDTASLSSDLPPPTSPTPQQASQYYHSPASQLSVPQRLPMVSTPSYSVRGAWAKGGPSFRDTPSASSQIQSDAASVSPLPSAWITRSSSYTSSSAMCSGVGTRSAFGNDEDEDLKFAIELSLAEQRSKEG